MQWENVDLAGAKWTQTGKETKNGDLHQFHLPPLALDMLKRRHQEAGQPTKGYVFPAPRSGKAIDTFGKAKKAVIDFRDHQADFVHVSFDEHLMLTTAGSAFERDDTAHRRHRDFVSVRFEFIDHEVADGVLVTGHAVRF